MPTKRIQDLKLTKADTVALWHAVDALGYQLRSMHDMAEFTPEQISAERARLLSAKRALRKANAIRKAQEAFAKTHVAVKYQPDWSLA